MPLSVTDTRPFSGTVSYGPTAVAGADDGLTLQSDAGAVEFGTAVDVGVALGVEDAVELAGTLTVTVAVAGPGSAFVEQAATVSTDAAAAEDTATSFVRRASGEVPAMSAAFLGEVI
jgi:hypothetical protein